MKLLKEYLSTKVKVRRNTNEIIQANNSNVREIIEKEVKRLGKDADLNHIDVSQCTSLERAFSDVFYFCGDISEWDVSNVEDMRSMFGYAESFNQNISNWNPAKINKKIQCQNIWAGKCPIKERFKPKFQFK